MLQSKTRPMGVKVPDFPKLMRHENGTIVLFHAKQAGTTVNSIKDREFPWQEIGHYSAGWYTTDFKDYYGEVTLSNV